MSTVNFPAIVPAAPTVAARDLVARLLGEALFWLVMLQLINGVYLQAQLAAFDGAIVVPNGVPKMALVLVIGGLAAVSVLVRRGELAWRACMLPACLFAFYLVADLAYLATTTTLPLETLLFGFNKFFLFFAALPAAALLRPQLSSAAMQTRILILALPVAALALAQFALNDPILSLSSADQNYAVHSVEFYGRIRAFSLFRGVLECGQGLAFFGALLLAKILLEPARGRWWKIAFWLVIAAACFVTFRRGAYLEFATAGLAAVLIARRGAMARWLPWLYLAAGLGVGGGGKVMSIAQGEGLLSSESLAERHDAWGTALHAWVDDGPIALLFGCGRTQVDPDDIDNLLIDNGFLAVGVQTGLVGLVLWIWLMQSLWRDMLATAWRWRTPLATAVAALLATWMIRDVFDPLFALYPLFAFLVFWSHHDGLRDVTPAGARQVTA